MAGKGWVWDKEKFGEKRDGPLMLRFAVRLAKVERKLFDW